MTDNAKLLTTGDVARYCGVSRVAVNRWIRQNKLQAHSTPGGHYRIRAVDFQDFLRNFDIPSPPSSADGKSRRILVVANDASTLGTVVRTLSAMPEQVEIDVALDSLSATAKIVSFKPALVILETRGLQDDALTLTHWAGDAPEQERAPALLLTMPVVHELDVADLAATFSSITLEPLQFSREASYAERLRTTVRRLLAAQT